MDPARIKRLEKALEDFTREYTSSPAKAKEAMVMSGIYLENGELSPNYKSPEDSKKHEKK